MTKAKSLLNLLEADDSISKLVKEYVITLLWSESYEKEGENDRPLDDDFSYKDMSKEALDKIAKDIKAFLDKASDLIDNDEGKYQGNYGHAMHDFCLTRNHHGAGFWDGDWTNGEELTKIAHSFGEMNAYPGDDGKIYV